MTLHGVFGSAGSITWKQECARTVVILVYGLALVRIVGRRAFGKWSAIDIIVSVIIGSNLSRSLTGNAPFVGTFAATTVLMALHWALVHLAARLPWFSRLVEGTPIPLASGGEAHPAAMRRGSVSEYDLNEALRQSGTERVEDTKSIVLEPSGKINVIKKN